MTRATVRRKRLIEVAFPLEEVSAHSRREKNVRHGHISTLHIWWARRPLAACRAFIYASLVDDPQDDAEREELLKEVADLASWDAVRHPEDVVRPREQGGSGLTGHELLERARRRILDCNDGKPPRLLDPFAGGGAIPLEALRLGCQVEASDLNPVAVLILKGTVEYPQKYGQQNSREVPDYIHEAQKRHTSGQASFFDGDLVDAYRNNPLATDVRYWGNWMLERARRELGEFYPPDPDGSVPVAYLWSRTVPCPNCKAEMPLIRQYWLARKEKRRIALTPVIDESHRSVDFAVSNDAGTEADSSPPSNSRGDTMCLLCRQVAKVEYVRKAGREGLMRTVMTAAVLDGGSGGRRYRPDNVDDMRVFEAAEERLTKLISDSNDDVSLVPDEPIARETLGLRVDEFGLDHWGDLFNARQKLSLLVLSQLVRTAFDEMLSHGLTVEYGEAVSTYLALAVDRLADRGSTLCRWDPSPKMEALQNTYARQALSMIWDYGEGIPLSESAGGFATCLSWILLFLELESHSTSGRWAKISARDATAPPPSFDLAITDPPYYNAIDYAGLSDFFYVWLKRSLRGLHGSLLELPLTPKREQAIMPSETDKPDARSFYVEKMSRVFAKISATMPGEMPFGIVFAHTNGDAWSTLIEGLLRAGLAPDASWPIDTELENKTSASSRANLKTSVWMSCTPRGSAAGEAFIADVMSEMRPVIRERLLVFWSKGIRGADFFISAIGPALSVFGLHSKVLRPDGTDVTVRDFLDLVRRESTRVALEQVLQGADLGVIDPATQQYITWVWSYSRAPLDAGEAIALCLATGADYGEVVRPNAIATEVKEKSKKLVKLRTIKERGEKDENLGLNQNARATPLVDQLQRAAWLWSLNRSDELASYRAALGEARWQALRTLGQAVAECLPEGDDDRRLINGLLSSSVMGSAPPKVAAGSLDAATVASKRAKAATAGARLPGLDEEGGDGD